MKVNDFIKFGRPQSGTMIIQLLTELNVSNQKIREQQYHNRLQSKTMRLFLRLKIACHNAHILRIFKRQ